jgi:hypothetical protein
VQNAKHRVVASPIRRLLQLFLIRVRRHRPFLSNFEGAVLRSSLKFLITPKGKVKINRTQ